MEGLKAHSLAVCVLPNRRKAVGDGDLRLLRMDDADHGRDRRGQQFRNDRTELICVLVSGLPAVIHRLEAGGHGQLADAGSLDRTLPLHRISHEAPVGKPIWRKVRVHSLHILHQIRPVTVVVDVVGCGGSKALNALLVLSASSSCAASGKPSSDENQASFHPPRSTNTLPASACAENRLNRVTLSPYSGVARTA